ncbi:MAG: VWA domain-containing protein [Gemmatimonadetes bacterium]|nr:VWA domain-containing protein [Gemmatimonadota bacterium]
MQPDLLWLLLPTWVTVAAADAWRARRRRILLLALGAEAPTWPGIAGTALVLAAASLVIVALAGPARPAPAPATAGAGRGEALIVLDVSRSMATRDVAPARSALARLAAARVASEAEGARVGLAAFAAEAHVLAVPTGDLGLVLQYVTSLGPDAVTFQGTDLARALTVAVGQLTRDGRRSPARSVVLISDGEGFEDPGALAEALSAARRAGVAVHTVLTGTAEGGSVPGVLTGGRSSARPDLMERIARETGGRHADARDGRALAVLAEAVQGAPGQGPPGPWAPSRAAWLPLAALVALLCEGFWLGAWARRPA